MQLTKYQLVRFPNGAIEGWLEARWSERNQAFYTFDEDGNKIFSNDVVEKIHIPKKVSAPSAKTCTVQIFPSYETERCYAVEDGSNGKITRGNMRQYYKYIAKSICYVDENGNIFAPHWAC